MICPRISPHTVFETGVTKRLRRATFRPPRSRETGGVGLREEQVQHAAQLAGPETWQLVRQQGFSDLPEAQPRGRPEKERDTFIIGRPDTAEKIVARLKRDDPELAERVVRGEVTPNAAALMKGWRHPRIVVTSPEAVAAALRTLDVWQHRGTDTGTRRFVRPSSRRVRGSASPARGAGSRCGDRPACSTSVTPTAATGTTAWSTVRAIGRPTPGASCGSQSGRHSGKRKWRPGTPDASVSRIARNSTACSER